MFESGEGGFSVTQSRPEQEFVTSVGVDISIVIPRHSDLNPKGGLGQQDHNGSLVTLAECSRDRSRGPPRRDVNKVYQISWHDVCSPTTSR